jgi:hypothetical protein
MSNGHFSKMGMFFVGFFTGILLLSLAGVIAAGYVLKNPQAVMAKVAYPQVGKIIEKTAATAPKEYIGQKQDDIAVTAQAFARAYSESRISPDDIQLLGARVFAVLSDQQITPAEIDDLLRTMKAYAGVPESIPDSGTGSGIGN